MRPVLVAVTLLVTAGFCAATSGTAVAVADADAGIALQSADDDAATNNSSDPSLGVSISTFMQGNAEQTGETIRHGMWRVAFDDSDGADREALAAKRVDELQRQVEEIREARRSLRQARENGTIDRATFVARMSALEARAESVTNAVRATAVTLERASVETPGMSELATATEDASTVAGGSPGGNDRPGSGPGPGVGLDDSDDRTGPPDDIWLLPGNGSDSPRENESDQPGPGLAPPGDNESDPIDGPGTPGTDPPERNESDDGDEPVIDPPEHNESDGPGTPGTDPPDDNDSDPVRDPDGNHTTAPPGLPTGDDSPENETTTSPDPGPTERLTTADRAATRNGAAGDVPASVRRFAG